MFVDVNLSKVIRRCQFDIQFDIHSDETFVNENIKSGVS